MLRRGALEAYLRTDLKVVSFHNPDQMRPEDLARGIFAGMANVYSPDVTGGYKYVSDSNGYWRFDNLFDVVAERQFEKLHVLTHPVWWTPEPMSPRDRVIRAVDGRAKFVVVDYDNMLANAGRLNVK